MIQTLVDRYINDPVSRVWADPSLTVDQQLARVMSIWDKGAARIKRETGYVI